MSALAASRHSWHVAALALCLLAPGYGYACRGERGPPRGIPPWHGGQGGGGLDLDNDCAVPEASATCGTQVVAVRDLHVDLYFVVDRSSSMDKPLSSAKSWLDGVVAGVSEVWTRHKGAIRIGATLFPADSVDDDCEPGFEVWSLEDCEGLSHEEVATGLSLALNVSAFGHTPIATTFEQLRDKPPAFAKQALAVLLTDGIATCLTEACSETCAVDAVAAFRAETGVDVLVVAAAPVDEHVPILNAYAVAGGRPLEGNEKFLRLEDGTLPLLAYLDEIVAAHPDPCTIRLEDVPEKPQYVDVFFDCAVIPPSATNGWHWSAADEITLRGTACEAARGFDVAEITVVEGCGPAKPAR